ncbi:Disease resistance protein L6 [Linum perenne]
MDDKKLPRGETIKTSMSTAIERSRLSVVVFSSGYADSKWCLDELCQDQRHVTMPLFFHVLPCDVACQSGAYEEAFQRHATSFKKKRVQNWRKALVAVAGISGWCLRENE